MDEEHTVLSVTSCGVTHSVVLGDLVTSDEFFRQCVALAKAQGYILTNIEESLETALSDLQEELTVINKYRNK